MLKYFCRKLKRDSAANLEASLATEKLLQEKEAEVCIQKIQILFCS